MHNSKYPILLDYSKERYEFKKKNKEFKFSNNSLADELITNLKEYPHAYVLGCCMDRQDKSERCWLIPYKIKEIIGSFKIEDLGRLKREEYIDIFDKNNLHRFKKDMGSVFYDAVHLILNKYKGDASGIWAGNPSSSSVVCNFLEFKGIGVKIATMATNILARDFDIPIKDMYAIDISPDTHVKRVFSRMGITPVNPSNEQIIYAAKDIYPEFPGIVDYSVWQIGREWCTPTNPQCEKCVVNKECDYYKNNKL